MRKAYSKQIEQFGSKIKRLRERRGMTQQDLSDKCEIDIRTIQRIEKGKNGVTLQVLLSLAESLDLTASQLLSKINSNNNNSGELSN